MYKQAFRYKGTPLVVFSNIFVSVIAFCKYHLLVMIIFILSKYYYCFIILISSYYVLIFLIISVIKMLNTVIIVVFSFFFLNIRLRKKFELSIIRANSV